MKGWQYAQDRCGRLKVKNESNKKQLQKFLAMKGW